MGERWAHELCVLLSLPICGAVCLKENELCGFKCFSNVARTPLADEHNEAFCVYSGAYLRPTHSESWMDSLPHLCSVQVGSLGTKGALSLVAIHVGRFPAE